MVKLRQKTIELFLKQCGENKEKKIAVRDAIFHLNLAREQKSLATSAIKYYF